ncbi:MAG: RNA methyltransferase [Clostridia bacterium]|nr:RNA methyltransferase [Clostridia bacterium]
MQPLKSMIITSRSNERVKSARALQDAKARKETGLHLIEGDKLVWDAIRSGVRVKTIFAKETASVPDGIETVRVSESVMDAIGSAKTPQNLCAVVETPDCACPERYAKGLWIALDRLQDPGNLGTIIRTADALGAAGVLISVDSTDPFSPKALRAAMGSTYHLPIAIGALDAELPRLKEQGFVCVCGHLKGTETLPPVAERAVLVVGNEGQGVSESTAALCERYRMPMRGRAESLNAAVFAALMMQTILNGMQ